LRMMAFQVLAGVFEMVAMRCLLYPLRIGGVPKVYRVTQGLKVKNAYLIDKYGGQGQNRTADTGIFRPQWLFLASLLSTTYAQRPRAKLPQVERSGHEMTGVGHDMVTLEHVYIIRNSYLKKIL